MEILNNYTKEILFYLNKSNKKVCLCDISRGINSFYQSLSQKVCSFKEIGIVECTKEGRKMIVSLTPKGEKVIELLYKIDKLLKW